MTLQYFQELANYNIWANDINIDWLESITEEQWNQPVVSSFGSIGATVLHIAGAERIWHDRVIKAESPVWLPNVFKGNKHETLELWKMNSLNLKVFLEKFDADQMNTPLTFKRINGESYEMLHYHVFAHVFNHSTYHRGQILLMLRQVGYEQVSSTDMLGFFRKK